MKFKWVDASLVIITIHLFVWNMPPNREDFFLKYINLTLLTPKFPLLWVEGHEIYNFLSPYPTDATYQIW